jgi:hypothetical protein
MTPPRAAATVPATAREVAAVDTDMRYIIRFPDGRRADSTSIGIQVDALPMIASVVAAGDLPVAPPETPWDETAAKANLLTAAGDDEDAYGRAFLFHDDAQSGPESYYWPIADAIDGQVMVVPAAVDAALSAIDDGTIGTLTPEEKDATVAILNTYIPAEEPALEPEAIQGELKALRARVNAFDEFMNDYMVERVQAHVASIIDAEEPLPVLVATL